MTAERKTGCFPLRKSGRFVFAAQAIGTVRRADRYQSKSFASGERRVSSKKKSRLTAGDAPEQISNQLNTEQITARAP